MHVWLLFLAGTTAYDISRISETDFTAVNFAKAIGGRKLSGSVISEEDVDSESSCQVNCVKEEKCLSYNFARTKNKAGRFKCQLSNSDRFVGIANFSIIDMDFKYVGIQTACEAYQSPCGDKKVCIPDYKGEGVEYKCVNADCPAGLNKYGTSCYYINDTYPTNWGDARAVCQTLGADLPIIKSAEQNKFIKDLLHNQTTNVPWGGAWIGMRRKDDKRLYWIDGTPWEGRNADYFFPGNPSQEDEGCVHMMDIGKWNDIKCAWNENLYGNHPYIVCMRSAIYSDLG